MDKMDKLDSFKVLPEAEYEIAKMLYLTGKSLGCKTVYQARALKNQPKGYRIIFNNRDANKVLFWMQISDNALYVKANLFHIDGYADKMAACSEKIKNAITTTKECFDCGLCPPRLPYHINNVKYKPCCFHGHYFSQLNHEEWHTLRDLIVLEHNNQCEHESLISPVFSERQVRLKPYHGFHKN